MSEIKQYPPIIASPDAIKPGRCPICGESLNFSIIDSAKLEYMCKGAYVLNNDGSKWVGECGIKDSQTIILPTEKGWYWVRTIYNKTIPCWFMPDNNCFLPAGMGDSSSMGIYEEDIESIGPKFEQPKF